MYKIINVPNIPWKQSAAYVIIHNSLDNRSIKEKDGMDIRQSKSSAKSMIQIVFLMFRRS